MEITTIFKENSDLITTLTAISALLISTFAIIRATQDNRKQIIVGKIEEIYEVTIFLFVEYSKLHHLATKLNEIYISSSHEFDDNLENFHILVKEVYKTNDLNEIYDKTLRLNVLANSYLNNKIKMELIAYARLFQCILATVHSGTLERKKKEFKEGLHKK